MRSCSSNSFSNIFVYKIHALTILADKFADNQLRKKLNISLSQFMVMMMIGECSNVSQKDVSYHLNHTESAVSRQVKILEDTNFVLRTVDKADRRRHVLKLTNGGKRVLDKAHIMLKDLNNVLLEELPKSDVDQMNKSIDVLIHNIFQKVENK